jgi:hypothetical protein
MGGGVVSDNMTEQLHGLTPSEKMECRLWLKYSGGAGIANQKAVWGCPKLLVRLESNTISILIFFTLKIAYVFVEFLSEYPQFLTSVKDHSLLQTKPVKFVKAANSCNSNWENIEI